MLLKHCLYWFEYCNKQKSNWKTCSYFNAYTILFWFEKITNSFIIISSYLITIVFKTFVFIVNVKKKCDAELEISHITIILIISLIWNDHFDCFPSSSVIDTLNWDQIGHALTHYIGHSSAPLIFVFSILTHNYLSTTRRIY